MHPFCHANILLPRYADMEKWAVIACDQFASQPEYWAQARQLVGDAPSALKLILPESELEGDCSAAIATIHETMRRYLQEALFQTYENSFIYVERTLENGTVRRGVVGGLDLCSYDSDPNAHAIVRATEETVAERVPPRMEIRRGASLELPHVLLLCDDFQKQLIESLTAKKDSLPLLYDFDLMLSGGRIRGWLVAGEDEKDFSHQLELYARRTREKYGETAVLYALGDGNHSVAAAKACYLENPHEKARYALVELENIHDDAQVFEPIHRIVKDTEVDKLIRAMEDAIGGEIGAEVTWHAAGRTGTIRVAPVAGQLTVGTIQVFLDNYLRQNPGVIDYIHGLDAVVSLSQAENAVGFVLPGVDKGEFFHSIIVGGTLPRKTFSMGHAREKRYYLEARRIDNF